eukprot:SAG31_NODE_28350_length_411_cov_0.996795_1_plen_85_part_00
MPNEDKLKASLARPVLLRLSLSDTCFRQIYALYKQATTGDVTGGQPYKIQMEKRAKWDARNELKGDCHAIIARPHRISRWRPMV